MTSQATSRIVIGNVGTVLTGDIAQSRGDADTIVVEDKKIAFIGSSKNVERRRGDVRVDAHGLTAIPGLIDSHTHPALGDWTPRLNAQQWMEHYVNGGITSAISQGAIHLPGRPDDPSGTKALAILSARSFARFRPGGLKFLGGAVILEPGLVEADFTEMAAQGVRLIAEIGAAGLADPVEAAPMSRWAKAHGMVSVGHFGPPSIPGSTAMDADAMIALDVDVVAHANGGSTSGNWADVVRLVDETEKIIELAFTGNPKTLLDIADRMRTGKALERVILGSDTPVGSGLMPLGILRIIVLMCALGEMAPETAICLATGNTARVYGLSSGVLVEGRDADVLLIDAPHGSYASDFSSAARRGDNPAIAMIMIDGSIVTCSPKNTLPSNRQATIRIDE